MLLAVSDAFIDAVEEARRRLVRQEGRGISIRELARRAGLSHATLAYNLRPGARPRRIDPDLVRALARVLPVDEGELMRAAQVSSGYQTTVPLDSEGEGEGAGTRLGSAVVRFLDDEDAPEEEKERLRARLRAIVAEEMLRSLENHDND